ncbi:glycosyltransferase family 4 protein, partial [Gammaproteobacteria bacterium]|nr:glycosyltransferase family 4 protein [Gammaproteobacteria bacterium]
GIDAANLRAGGGLTMLHALINNTKTSDLGFKKIYLWGGRETLDSVSDQDWLIKKNHSMLNKNFIFRIIWQIFILPKAARELDCNVLFIPGGSYFGSFRPIVSMSTNLLPFEIREMKRFGFSINTLRLLLLRFTQSHTFRHSDGLIFLSSYAKEKILSIVKNVKCQTKIIPFGVTSLQPINNGLAVAPLDSTPVRLIYVSFIGPYKHQINVVHAVHKLREQKYNVTIDLVGPNTNKKYSNRLIKLISNLDPQRQWVNLAGELSSLELQKITSDADIGVFASSCENLPNILLEMMSAGIPIACSSYGPMPEVLQNGGEYFDPENPESISKAIQLLIDDPDQASYYAENNKQRSREYSWEIFSKEVFKIMLETAKLDNKSI